MIVKKPRVFPKQGLYPQTKRVLDLIFCILILPFIIPLMVLCAIAIYLESVGPIIFVQDRIGKGGKNFRMYKFRTIKVDFDKENSQAYMKDYIRGTLAMDESGNVTYKPIKGDSITKVGKILRRTSLDELPQIINVLKGEMSIIGPRPNVVWEVEEYRPWHHERFEVLPGITGLAQVRGRSCIDFKSLVRYDIEYIENQNLLLDLKILWWTFLNTILRKGAS